MCHFVLRPADLIAKNAVRVCITYVLLCFTGALIGTGCDTTATFRLSTVQFDPADPMRVIGATPLKAGADGNFTPACDVGDVVTGFRVHFNLKSTEHKGGLSGNNDRQVREGDRVGGKFVSVGPGRSISTQSFVFGDGQTLDQMVPLNGNGSAFDKPKATPRSVQFVERNKNRRQPVAVALLVDHSASMIGFVEPEHFYETKTLVGQKILNASDEGRSRFQKAGTDFVQALNSNDRLIAWYFNDQGVVVACTDERNGVDTVEALPNEVAREKYCFACSGGDCRDNHRWVFNADAQNGAFNRLAAQSGTVAGLKVNETGRTPLWAAANRAWDFLTANAVMKDDGKTVPMARHIVIVTDSPDTCHPGSVNFVPDEPCGDTDFATFRSKVLATPVADRIPISIIQIQSKGYTDPDPAQMEITCLTSGTYQWINNLAFPVKGQQLSNALAKAFENIRDTLGGYWVLDAEAPAIDTPMPPGEIIALAGTMTFSAPDLLSATDTESFRLIEQDKRLLLRKTCSDDNTCGGSAGDCVVTCNPDGNVCATPNKEPWRSQGDCCCGQFSPGLEQCTALREPCCTVPIDTTAPDANFLCQP